MTGNSCCAQTHFDPTHPVSTHPTPLQLCFCGPNNDGCCSRKYLVGNKKGNAENQAALSDFGF